MTNTPSATYPSAALQALRVLDLSGPLGDELIAQGVLT
jgi:hypothetical protein